ncbi:hypothetical protein HS041_10535 [Planomonospora sp. ID67723]|uniref:hypothetical protein n=1 Tax=Planomonospora sp. ID67723 TaxID=2738134 RepID=UPI0018C430B2|nr:hypothetical protein [Planomonospora sp. ID67723]MBG0828204.1 hypothetical protein [Planomonospora sp. ID67723]
MVLMTTPAPTPGQVARRAWQIRPSLLELLAVAAVLVVARLWLGWSLLPGALFMAALLTTVAVTTAASELQEEAETARPPETGGGDDAAV